MPDLNTTKEQPADVASDPFAPRFALFLPVSALLFIAALTFAFPLPPLADWPEWVFQAEVFNRLLRGELSDSFHLASYPVPYAAIQLLTSGFIELLGAVAAARAVILLYGVLGIALLARLIARRGIEPYLGWSVGVCAILLNTSFFNGYIGFQFGLLLIVLYLGRDTRRPPTAFEVALLSTSAFLLHGMAYLALMIFIGCASIADKTVRRTALAAVPSVALAAWYAIASRAHPVHTAIPGAERLLSLVARVAKVAYRVVKVGPYHNFVVDGRGDAERFGRWYLALGALSCVVLLALLALVIAAGLRRRQGKLVSPLFLASAVLAVAALALPPFAMGIVNPGERLLAPAVLGLMVALAARTSAVTLVSRAGKVMASAVLAGTALSAVSLLSWRGALPETAFAPVEVAENKPFQHLPFSHFDRKEWIAGWPVNARAVPALVFETALVRNGSSPTASR
ncbi:MAG: hypothetical protein JWN04_4970 [Myxococcaceae bacterium]|nr:hypothetical protein [Myxococcaceae bacterium]